MLLVGIVLIILGYWFLPEFVPQFPPQLDHLCYGVGVLLAIIGCLLFLLGLFGHSVGGRRYWY
jgi:Family of unknown function (DUF6131)